jgi:hypothetical protein
MICFKFRRIKWEIKLQTFSPLIYLLKLYAQSKSDSIRVQQQLSDPIVKVTLIYEMLAAWYVDGHDAAKFLSNVDI